MINSFHHQFITIINYFSNTFIFFLLFLFGYLEITGEAFVTLSLITIFTQGFSANIRNIYLGSTNTVNLKKEILFRTFVGIIGIFFTILLIYIFFGKSNILFHFSVIFSTVINWILELPISNHEKIKSKRIYYSIYCIFFLVTSLLLIIFNNILSLSIFIFLNSLFNILIYQKFFRHIFNRNIFIVDVKFDIGVFSSFIKTVVNFSWRYFIIIFVGRSDASFLFTGIAIGSFFGTLFDVSYGAFFLKKIKNKKYLINFFFTVYVFLILLILYFIKNFMQFENIQLNILLTTIIFSVFGAYFTIVALQKRQLLFEKVKYIKACYKADIYIYTINFFIILIICIINPQFLVISYFVSSIFFYFVYIILFRNVHSKKTS